MSLRSSMIECRCGYRKDDRMSDSSCVALPMSSAVMSSTAPGIGCCCSMMHGKPVCGPAILRAEE